MGWKWKSKLQRQCQEPEKDEKIIFLNMAVRIIPFGRSKFWYSGRPREFFTFFLFTDSLVLSNLGSLRSAMEFENQKLRKIFRELHPMHESRLRFLELRHSVSIFMTHTIWVNLYQLFRTWIGQLSSWQVSCWSVENEVGELFHFIFSNTNQNFQAVTKSFQLQP